MIGNIMNESSESEFEDEEPEMPATSNCAAVAGAAPSVGAAGTTESAPEAAVEDAPATACARARNKAVVITFLKVKKNKTVSCKLETTLVLIYTGVLPTPEHFRFFW